MESRLRGVNEDDEYEILQDEDGDYNLIKKTARIMVRGAYHFDEGEEGVEDGMEDEIGSTYFPGAWVVQVGDEIVYIGRDERLAVEQLWAHRGKDTV